MQRPFEEDRPQLDWSRLLPQSDHRWAMGLRPGDLGQFVRPWDPSGQLLRERRHCLAESSSDFAAMSPAAEAALAETVPLIREAGISVSEVSTSSEQLLELGRSWESDFVWMVSESGIWKLAGGVVCFPSSWSMPAKLGQPMAEVHAPVPELNSALGRQIETSLTRMESGKAWLRENVGLSRDDQRNHLPARPRRVLDDTTSVDEVYLRVESQLLYKLPRCGQILFGIRVEVFPLIDLLGNPVAIAGLRRLLSSISPSAAEYKGLAKAREVILKSLG